MSSQMQLLELCVSMRKTAKRTVEDSDSDDSVDLITNRGNKLRKKAKYVHEGQLAAPSGSKVYRKTITYGDRGYQRDIISSSAYRLYDSAGYEVDREDDDDRAQEAIAAAAEFDPYTNVKIEHLLAPLTAASDLPTHPTLSRPFTSVILTELAQNACEMLQKEKASLWKMKHLLTRLGGDHTWVPCGLFETENDILLFGNEHSNLHDRTGKTNSTVDEEGHPESIPEQADEDSAPKPTEDAVEPDDVAMIEAPEEANKQAEDPPQQTVADSLVPTIDEKEAAEKAADEPDPDDTIVEDSTILEDRDAEAQDAAQVPMTNGKIEPGAEHGEELTIIGGDEMIVDAEDENIPPSRRMRTRAQAQADSVNTGASQRRSLTPEFNESYIHPIFLAPESSKPERDLGIPSNEAEDTRRLLQLYIQKQEEVCRGAEKVYNGLLKADRLRQTVLAWTKAEGHIGELPGEEWWDKEFWKLDEDLKEGQDEDEDDQATTAKKTRTRRQ